MSFFLQNNFSEFKKKSLSKSDLSLFTIFLSAILLYNTHTSNTLQIFNHDNVVKHEFIFKNAEMALHKSRLILIPRVDNFCRKMTKLYNS